MQSIFNLQYFAFEYGLQPKVKTLHVFQIFYWKIEIIYLKIEGDTLQL